jgi:hypothetical protein
MVTGAARTTSPGFPELQDMFKAQLPGDNIGQRCRFRHDNSNYFVVPSNTFRRRMAMIIYKRGQQLVLDLVV